MICEQPTPEILRRAAGESFVIGKTAIVTDSASYLPQHVQERYGIRVVPLTVLIDDQPHLEFIDIDTETFYRRLSEGAKVATSQPPPGAFLRAYEEAKVAGAEEVVSIHIGSKLSGTVNSARIAAADAGLPVHVIDTGQASFVQGLCAWEACEALAAGSSIEEAETVVSKVASAAGNIFMVRGLELLQQGGRMARGTDAPWPGVPVLALTEGAIRPIAQARSVEAALDTMTAFLEAAIRAQPGQGFRVGVADGAAGELAEQLFARVAQLPGVEELVRYEVGPAVGAHTGPGCTGLVFLGRPLA